VDFFSIAISHDKVHDDIAISSLLPLAPMTQVACSRTSASMKHRADWDGNRGRTGTVAQSDKSTTHTDSSHSHPSNDIVTQCRRRRHGKLTSS